MMKISARKTTNYQDPKNSQAVVIKAEGLYNMCRFEHAFALFSKVNEPTLLQYSAVKRK